MENPLHLISTLFGVFWAAAEWGWAALPKQGSVLRPVVRLKSSALEGGRRRPHIPVETVPEWNWAHRSDVHHKIRNSSLLPPFPLGFSTGEKALPRKNLFSLSLAKTRVEPTGFHGDNTECQPGAPVHPVPQNNDSDKRGARLGREKNSPSNTSFHQGGIFHHTLEKSLCWRDNQ